MSGPLYETGEARAETPEAEVLARVDRALGQIEAAQYLLSSAAANLSPIIGVLPMWETAGKLSDRAHNLWRKLAYNTRRGWKLDGNSMQRFGPRIVKSDDGSRR